ncbi:MAG: dipeptide epimerase [Sandaracinus sp.]|nr:dipeptide epimerase [Sandaracinus sp.]
MKLAARVERWPIRGVFRTAKVARRETVVVVVEVRDRDGVLGRGECVPYDGYGETVESVLDQLRGEPEALLESLPPGAARNGVDLALLDLECRRRSVRIHQLLGRPAFTGTRTAYTLGIDSAEAVERGARERASFGTLKLKAGPEDAVVLAAAARRGAPSSALVVDGNESWSWPALERVAEPLAALGVIGIEQPLPRDADAPLRRGALAVPVYADESCHGVADVARLAERYDGVNLKLGKTGGLRPALEVHDASRAAGLEIMVGCAVSTSLAIAPALLLTEGARVVDLDGPLLIERDREPGITYEGDHIAPFPAALWG